MRTQICEAAVEERWIDVLLEDIEHGVDEADQFVQGGDRLFYVAIGDGVEQGNVAVNRLLQILATREFGVIEPADTSKNRMQRTKRGFDERLPRRRDTQLIHIAVHGVEAIDRQLLRRLAQ